MSNRKGKEYTDGKIIANIKQFKSMYPPDNYAYIDYRSKRWRGWTIRYKNKFVTRIVGYRGEPLNEYKDIASGDKYQYKTFIESPCIGCYHEKKCASEQLACRDFFDYTVTGVKRKRVRNPKAEFYKKIFK